MSEICFLITNNYKLYFKIMTALLLTKTDKCTPKLSHQPISPYVIIKVRQSILKPYAT